VKFGPILLLDVICVAIGLFLYDALKEEGAKTSASHAVEDPLRADAVGETSLHAPSGDADSPWRAQRNEERLDLLEAALETLRGALGDSAAGAAGGEETRGLDVGRPAGGRFDEDTLAAIGDYLHEINRRKGALRQRRRMEIEFRRRGLDLTAEEQEAVIAATLEFQRKAGSLKAPSQPGDEAARSRQLDAYRALQEEYVAAIREHLSEEKADTILKSRLGGGVIQPGGRRFGGTDADD